MRKKRLGRMITAMARDMAKSTPKALKTTKKTATKVITKPFDWLSLQPHPVIGVDEVGRGCLAGPVYAAAAIVPAEHAKRLKKLGVTDSKLLTSEKRDELALEIPELCLVSVAFATHEEIDAINILQASFLAMKRALADLEKKLTGSVFGLDTAHIIVDGHQRIPFRDLAAGAEVDTSTDRPLAYGLDRECMKRLAQVPQTPIVKGDLRALPIAVASIMAKVARDKMMTEAATEFPQYGFEKHKGYAAPIHRKAIEEHGPSRLHRKTFGGVREYLDRETRARLSIQQSFDL